MNDERLRTCFVGKPHLSLKVLSKNKSEDMNNCPIHGDRASVGD